MADIEPISIGSGEAFGLPTIPIVNPNGIGSGEAFGTLNVISQIKVTGIGSGEAFGTSFVGHGYAGGGTIYMGSIGANVPNVTLYFPLETSWNVNANIFSSKTLTWDVGDLPLFWFRVMGDCQEVSCVTGPVSYPQRCGSMFMTMVLAKTPKDVCEKLSRSNFVWKIAEMARFTTPANNTLADEMNRAGLIDINCNQLIPIPHCQYMECLPFCVDGQAAVDIGAEMFVYDTFFSYEATGGMSFGGSASTVRPDSISGSGGMSIGGSAETKSSQFNYVGSGGLIISGDAGITSTQFNVAGSGGIQIGGFSSYTSSHYGVQGDGGLSIGGSASVALRLSFASSGLSSIGPSFAGIRIKGDAVDVAEYYYVAAGSGGVVIGGEGRTMSSYFAGVGSGGMQISGEASSVSPDHHASGSGGIGLGGVAGARLVLPWSGSGGFVLGGDGFTQLNLSYQGLGGLRIDGEAGTNRFQGSGGFHMGGEAGINSTWKGLYVDEWGMNAVCENLEPVFGSGEAPAIIPSLTTISRCGVSIPTALQVSHNLNDSNVLSNFLHRNGFTLPAVFDMTYHRLTETWRGNYHFRGLADESTNDRWDFLVEWGCTNEAYGLATSPVWKFGFYIVRRNDQTGIDFDTRILVYLDTEPLASRFNNDGVNLSVGLNPFKKTFTVPSANATIQSSAYYDGIGLFKTPLWRRQLFDFRLNAVGRFERIPRYDIFPAFPQPGEYDVT
jgi:hypothetical protein